MFNQNLEKLKEKSNKLPLLPGVYIMKDSSENIIYIGKAKKLKNRVSQYFKNIATHDVKVCEMVSRVCDFEYVITNSEFEALVLECSLIKKYKPKYNILLKDDKGYYYLKITNEPWPRLKSAKLKLADGAKYIGPYTSIGFVSQILDSTVKIFKLPVCNRNFSSLNKIRGHRACLNYYIDQCMAPCIGKVKIGDYLLAIKNAEFFLTKSDSKIIKDLNSQMLKAAENLNFEKAAMIRDQINTLNKISKSKQKVILNTKEKNIDVIAFYLKPINDKRLDSLSCFKVFNYLDGKLSDSSEYIFKDIVSDPKSIRTEFIQQYYFNKDINIPDVVLVDEPIEYKEALENFLTLKRNKTINEPRNNSCLATKKTVKILCPKSGEFHKVIEMCKLNAKEIITQKLKMNSSFSENNKNSLVLEELKELLNLQKIPKIIESYDISNLKDVDTVGSMIVIEGGIFNKKLYKKFKIKSFIGQDDYKAMTEVITRRFKEYRSAKETNAKKNGFETLPDLILLDGGKGHVRTVNSVLNDLNIKVPVFGMVKDKKHKTRTLTNGYKEIDINENAGIYSFIYKVQEEVHRFTINYNKTLRNKNLKPVYLTNIKGVGETLAGRLITHFKTLENIKNADITEIMKIKGMNKNIAETIREFFK